MSNPKISITKYLSEIGRKGGQAKSPRKAKAARKNAKKGGWPKGRPRKPKSSHAGVGFPNPQ